METKRNEGRQEEKEEIREDLFKKLVVEDEDTVTRSMQRDAAAEGVEEDSDEGKDVEEDDAEGYVEVEEEDIE